MINFFQFAPYDKSLVYLSQIFGTMNGVIPQAAASTGSITLLGTMFQTFNSVILIIGALIVVYVTVVGLMMTSQEGEFMGKKWSNLWVPIRIVLGIATLVPSGTGYSVLQLIMMWAIVQGIGAADTLWNTVLGYSAAMGSPYAQGSVPSIGVSNSLNTLFSALVCDAAARITKDDPSGMNTKGTGYYCNQFPHDSFCKGGGSSFNPNKGKSGRFGPSGNCGGVEVCDASKACSSDSNSIDCLTCQAQAQALSAIVPTLQGIAKQFVEADYDYRDFYYNSYENKPKSNWSFVYNYCSQHSISQEDCCIPTKVKNKKTNHKYGCNVDDSKNHSSGAPNFPEPNDGMDYSEASSQSVKEMLWPFGLRSQIGDTDFIATATSYYMDQINNAVMTYIQMLGQSGKLNSDLKQAHDQGWIFAGGYFYTISETNNATAKLPDMKLSTVTMTSSNPMSRVRNDYRAGGLLVQAAGNSADQSGGSNGGGSSGSSNCTSSSGGGDTGGPGGPILKSASDSVTQTSCSMKMTVNDTLTNPLVNLQRAGTGLLMSVGILFLVFIILTVVVGALSDINFWDLGFGLFNPMLTLSPMVWFVIIPIFFGLLGIMITLGGMLAVYVPLIPYILFTFGAIGWMLNTIETMVAGPLVALGVLSPSGQHEVLGKAEPALMLLFNVFLRPSLMIFGLMAGTILSAIVVNMINALFGQAMLSIMSYGHGGSILEFLIFLGAYVMLIVAALNKCYQAIFLIPERVMVWIGGQAVQYGEAEAVGEAKKGTEAVSSGAGGALQGAREQAGAARREFKEKKGGGGGAPTV